MSDLFILINTTNTIKQTNSYMRELQHLVSNLPNACRFLVENTECNDIPTTTPLLIKYDE